MKHYTFILLLVLQLANLGLHAQTPEIDQLLKTLHEAKGKEKVDACAELSFKYYKIDPSKGIFYGEKALKMADSVRFPQAKAKAYNSLGANYIALGRTDMANAVFRKALKIANQFGDTIELAAANNRLGVMFEKTGLYDSALIVFKQALTLYTRLQDLIKVGKINENIGMIHLHRGELKSSLTFLLNAKMNYEKAGSKIETSSVLLKIGRVYFESHDTASAEKWYKKSKELALETHDVQSIAMAANTLGILYQWQELYAKALTQFEEVLTLIGESKNIRLLLAVYNNIGNVYSKMNQNKKAVVYHQKALAMAQELKDPLTIAIQQVSLGKTLIATQSYGLGSQLLNKASPVFGKLKAYNNLLVTYQALIEVNNKIEDYKQSVTYYEKFVALKDSLIRTEQNRTLDSLKVRLNTEQALSDNLLLEQKNLIQAKTISLQRTIMFSAFIFAFLLMGFIVFVIINRRKIKNINRLLALKNNEISAKANELNVKNQQLVEFAKYKDSMNSFLVHDLKNPLNTIVNANIEQLSKQEAEAFKHSGLRMLNIVTSLLDLSKYENQMLKLSVTHTYVGKMIQDASKEVLFLAKQKSISIALKFQSDYQVKVDAELIKRVFVNLFINAIKFSESGKQIHVFAENLAGSTVKISIADEGEGISPEYLPHVFERFTQEIPRNAGFSASTGIGLAFCKMAIEMHGGQIEVISDKGKGTTFWFTLPLVAPGPVETMIKDSIVIEAPKPANIILSKEEKDYLRPFCQKLQSISVYQLTDVKNTVIPIQENTPNLSVWKHALLKALSDCNEPSYRNLIMICHA